MTDTVATRKDDLEPIFDSELTYEPKSLFKQGMMLKLDKPSLRKVIMPDELAIRKEDLEKKMTSPDQDEAGIHLHCLNCYSSICFEHPSCPTVPCVNQCGVKYHSCKQNDHTLVCRKQARHCVNHSFGCPFEIDSISLMSHLEYCPASVVHCGVNWNRYPLYSKIRDQWLPFWQGNPVAKEDDLDVEFALSDQKHLDREMAKRMRKGKQHIQQSHKSNTKVDQDRIKKLEALLGGLKLSSTMDDDSVMSSNDEAFVTYDEIACSRGMNIATVVSNTDIRSGYYDLPLSCKDGEGVYKHSQSSFTDDDTNEYIISEDIPELTSNEQQARMEIYAKLKLSGSTLGLNLVVETMPKFQNQYPMYSFSCSKVFRRDQFTWHCRNIHCDIQSSLNGWMMERCPLAHYGCPYSQIRLKPKNTSVRFLKTFSCFTACPGSDTSTCYVELEGTSSVLDLPPEIIGYILSFLDNLSLNCVAKTCHLLKDICYNMLDHRGIVMIVWSKKEYKKSGSTSWKEDKKIRFFTTASSPMRQWMYTAAPPIGHHLATCSFFKRKELFKNVKLPYQGIVETEVNPSKCQTPESEYYTT